MREAYEAKKYAFVTDYVRLYALYTVGGIYVDTDVELLRPLDEFLSCEVFSGFESKRNIPTAVMGAVSSHGTVKLLLDYYNDKHFICEDGSYDMTTNVKIITDIIAPLGLRKNGKLQTVAGFTLYPANVFCPDLKRINNDRYMNSCISIHHFNGSWKSEKSKRREGSLLFKIIATPLSLLSRLLELIFGKRWVRLKTKIRKKVFKD